jgi:hypothetical protein
MPPDDKFEIRNETNAVQHVDAPGAGASKKVEPGDTIEVTAQVATGFYGCEGWALLKNGKEIGPEIEKADEKPKPSKPPRKTTSPADPPDYQE